MDGRLRHTAGFLAGGGDTPEVKHFEYNYKAGSVGPTPYEMIALSLNNDTLVICTIEGNRCFLGKQNVGTESFDPSAVEFISLTERFENAWPNKVEADVTILSETNVQIGVDGFEQITLNNVDEAWEYTPYTPELQS